MDVFFRFAETMCFFSSFYNVLKKDSLIFHFLFRFSVIRQETTSLMVFSFIVTYPGSCIFYDLNDG